MFEHSHPSEEAVFLPWCISIFEAQFAVRGSLVELSRNYEKITRQILYYFAFFDIFKFCR